MQIKRGAARRGAGMQFSFPFPASALTPRSLTIARRPKENAENFLSPLLSGPFLAGFLRPAAVVDRSRGSVAITLVLTRHLNATRCLTLLKRPKKMEKNILYCAINISYCKQFWSVLDQTDARRRDRLLNATIRNPDN